MKALVFGSNGLVGSSVGRILENSTQIDTVVLSNRQDTDLFNLDETKKIIEETNLNLLLMQQQSW